MNNVCSARKGIFLLVGGLLLGCLFLLLTNTPCSADTIPTMTANPDSILINQTSTVTAILKDDTGNPISDGTIEFTVVVGPGTVAPSLDSTGADGSATTTFTAPSSLSFPSMDAHIRGCKWASTVCNVTKVRIWEPVVPTTITSTANPTTIGKGDTSTVTATVKDQFGTLMGNVTVTFTVVSGPGSVSPSQGITSPVVPTWGQTSTTYTAPTQFPGPETQATVRSCIVGGSGACSDVTITVKKNL